MKMLATILLSILVMGTAHGTQFASSWVMLSDTSLGSPFVDRSPGPDLYWGTADDLDAIGQNSAGHASYGIEDSGFFPQFYSGTFSLILDDVTAAVKFTQVDTSSIFSCPSCVPAFFEAPLTSMLTSDSGGQNGGQFTTTRDYSYSWDLQQNTGDIFRATGSGVSVFAGETVEDIIVDPGLIQHFNTVIPFVPSDYHTVTYNSGTWEFLTGANAGLTGVFNMTAYSNVAPTVVPLPLPFLLFLSGLIALHRGVWEKLLQLR